MKTIMQELVDIMNADKVSFTEWFIDNYKMLLEKEKEQIMNAYEAGYEACDMDEVMEVNKKLTSGDLYYNMNYNQTK